MKTFILIVIFHVNSGSNISFQEFNSIKQCEYVRGLVYSEASRLKFSPPETAFCVEK